MVMFCDVIVDVKSLGATVACWYKNLYVMTPASGNV